ncbi:MAG: hypothetical protein M1825_004931 [Sarcosagium campestre]|nr:MAG: hypothetical protein M1825_004931 [Sarcosagium campestre]
MPSTAPSKPPVKIAAGGNHTLVHYASGEVYATGANDNGRCALWEASIFIAPDQSLYACGSGSKGELGLGPGVTHAKTPQPIMVLSDGSVYGWGNGRKGQLGEPAGVVWSPRRIQGVDFKVHRGACGRDFTYLAGDPDKASSP